MPPLAVDLLSIDQPSNVSSRDYSIRLLYIDQPSDVSTID